MKNFLKKNFLLVGALTSKLYSFLGRISLLKLINKIRKIPMKEIIIIFLKIVTVIAAILTFFIILKNDESLLPPFLLYLKNKLQELSPTSLPYLKNKSQELSHAFLLYLKNKLQELSGMNDGSGVDLKDDPLILEYEVNFEKMSQYYKAWESTIQVLKVIYEDDTNSELFKVKKKFYELQATYKKEKLIFDEFNKTIGELFLKTKDAKIHYKQYPNDIRALEEYKVVLEKFNYLVQKDELFHKIPNWVINYVDKKK